MLTAVISLLIWLLILGLVFYLCVWVLGLLGISIPDQVVKIVGAIIFLIVLLWLVQAMLSGGPNTFPRLL
jgi:uncharacterized membrane protein